MTCKKCGGDASDPYAVAGAVCFCCKTCYIEYLQAKRDAGERIEFNPRLLRVLKKD
jgi:hypothetical protein